MSSFQPTLSVSARQFPEAGTCCRFRPSNRPGTRIVARVTARCTFLCEHCLASAAGVTRGVDLSLSQWKTILAESRAIDAHKVLLTGGEPLLFEGLVELTAYLASLGISTDLNSTLSLLTPSLAGQLAEAGLTEASVSIAGTEEIHDRLHGRAGAWSRLLAGIKWLQMVGLPVDGSMYVTPENLCLVRATIEQAARLGLASFTISRALPVGHGMRYAGPTVPDADLAQLHHALADARAGRYDIPVRCVGLVGSPNAGDCGQGQSIIAILADGTLTPCALTRDTFSEMPKPFEIGLAQAVEVLRARVAQIRPTFCYGGLPA